MAKTFIEAIGYLLGRKAAQAKNVFDLMGGSDEESLRAEIVLGRDMALAVLDRTPLTEENEDVKFVAHIGRWLARHVTEKKLPFHVWVTAEREPKALALPGGPIFASWPLVQLCRGERDEIAFVLAHEMAHIVQRHTLDRIIQDAALTLLLRQAPGRHAASAWLNRTGRQVLSRAYSSDNELEADRFAVSLVERAGGDPLAAERLLERLASQLVLPDDETTPSYFSSHPPFAHRIANLRQQKRA